MPPRHLVLLAPSEGKAPDGDGPPWAPGTMEVAELDPMRRRVARAAGLARTVARNPTLPAIERYTGVLYRELDAASLPATARRRLARQVLVVSGLWGLVAPTDPIPDYRLKMSARAGDLGKLSTAWRPALTEALAPRAKGRLLWDLLPIEHAAAVDWGTLAPRQRITVRFVDAEDRTISHWNKLLKGSLVRWLVTTPPSGLEDLAAFDHPQGYRFDPAATVIDGDHATVVLRGR